MPKRTERFELMMDFAARVQKRDGFRALDLCCGPGSITKRLLSRFPNIEVVAVDREAWMLEIGRRTCLDQRVTWLEADVTDPGWVRRLPDILFDVIFTSTAVSSMSVSELHSVYASLRGIIDSGGLFVNSDLLPFGHGGLDHVARDMLLERESRIIADGADHWARFWSDAQSQVAFREFFPAGRLPSSFRPRVAASVAEHVAALEMAGFRDVREIWRYLEEAIIVARCP